MGNGGPNCLLAADSFKVGQDMGKQRKQMHKNKAARKTSGVGCEEPESIFTMHASQFSLLLCHCFEKSKLCLQKRNVCIHMYEGMQLSEDEAGKHSGRFCFREGQKQVIKLTSLRKGVGVTPADPAQGPSERTDGDARLLLCFS